MKLDRRSFLLSIPLLVVGAKLVTPRPVFEQFAVTNGLGTYYDFVEIPRDYKGTLLSGLKPGDIFYHQGEGTFYTTKPIAI